MAGPRPGGVTVVSILAWISGVLQVIGGALVLIAGAEVAGLAVIAWVTILLGLITIFVGIGLWRGNSLARIIATVVFVLNLVSAIIAVFSNPEAAWQPLISGLLALIGIILLWTRAASDFFRR